MRDSVGREARCQGPKCDARYIVSSRDHYFCSPECSSATSRYFQYHGKLPKPPIMLKDLLSYVRPEKAYLAEAERLRQEAEQWKQDRLARLGGLNG